MFQAVNFLIYTKRSGVCVCAGQPYRLEANVLIPNNAGLLSPLGSDCLCERGRAAASEEPPILCWKEMIIYHLVIHRDWVTRLTTGEHSEASSESRTEIQTETPSNHVQASVSLHDMNLKIRLPSCLFMSTKQRTGWNFWINKQLLEKDEIPNRDGPLGPLSHHH